MLQKSHPEEVKEVVVLQCRADSRDAVSQSDANLLLLLFAVRIKYTHSGHLDSAKSVVKQVTLPVMALVVATTVLVVARRWSVTRSAVPASGLRWWPARWPVVAAVASSTTVSVAIVAARGTVAVAAAVASTVASTVVVTTSVGTVIVAVAVATSTAVVVASPAVPTILKSLAWY